MRTLILTLVLVILAPPAEAVGWPFRCLACERDSHGKIKRSSASLRQFRILTGYPKGRKGYVIDHKLPLACANSQVEYKGDLLSPRAGAAVTRNEAAEIAYRLLTRHEAQNTKIMLVADALKAAYDRGIAASLKGDNRGLNASLGQEDQD